MYRFSRRILALVFTAALASLASPAMADAGNKTIKLHQDTPKLTVIDVGAKGKSHGDMVAFEAKVHGENGLNGIMNGLLITVDLVEGDETLEDRLSQIDIDFGGGDSLVISGKAVYPGGESEMTKGAPQLRAVVGGTGKYIGARGQITTTRNSDGSYDHVIELLP